MNDVGGCWVVGSILSAFWLKMGVRVVRRAVELFGGKEVEGWVVLEGWDEDDLRACGREVVSRTDTGGRLSLKLDLLVEAFGM